LGKQTKKYRKLNVGVAIANPTTGKVLYTYQADKLLTPASVVKVLTSGASLDLLGSNYRFPTEFFVDRPPSAKGVAAGEVGNLYIRGYGDPSIVSERVWSMVTTIRRMGVRKIKNIVIDDTLFDSSLRTYFFLFRRLFVFSRPSYPL
jgi:D-alanyl-D-alanine carboxypeptidase/D-alanyl-D-alanine-endopeptidase (penicillin-binding protein 4)